MFTCRCEICGEKFESTLILDEAVQQYQQQFPGAPLNDQIQIACDDCFCLLIGVGAALHEREVSLLQPTGLPTQRLDGPRTR